MEHSFELVYGEKYQLFFDYFLQKGRTHADAHELACKEADRTRIFDFTGYVRQF